ncbi:major capsid protein P2 [Microbulbifer sp. ARAS458-1]|uniref:major capsid protein P2 n=1 Tax=Microbulbifer sp. ARAS458-1 TaxID=3140242 RepID=UPI0038779A97
MARIRDDIPLVENVAPGQRALIKPAVGRTWLDVHIEHTNIALSEMKNIEVILVSPTRSVTLWKFKDGTELNELNKRYNRKVAAGTLSFYFRRTELDDEMQRMSTALGTGGLQSVRIEFDIDENVTSPAVKAWGRKTANRHISQSLLTYIGTHNIGGNAEGENHFDSIEKRDRIAAIHVLNDGVEKLELRVDDAVAYKLARARGDFEESLNDRTPYGAGVGRCIDFLLAGTLDESLVMQDRKTGYQVQQMRLTTTLGTGAGSQIRYLVEYLSTWASVAGGNTQAAA